MSLTVFCFLRSYVPTRILFFNIAILRSRTHDACRVFSVGIGVTGILSIVLGIIID